MPGPAIPTPPTSRGATVVALCLLAIPAGHAVAGEAVGFRGHGNGVCRGSTTVPTGFSEEEGVRWKVSLPSIGHSSPIVVDGRVLVTCDGGHELQTPTLLCYDADSGGELWRAPIDVIETLPQALRDEARVRRAREWERLARWGEECWRIRQAGEVKELRGAVDPASNEAGYPVALNNPPTAGLIGYRPKKEYGMEPQAEHLDNYEWLRDHQVLFYDHWWYHYTKVFPTPVSDGERVWVQTSLDVAACYDLASGERRWIVRLVDDSDKWKEDPDAQVSSPVLIGDTLVVKRENTASNKSFVDCTAIGLDAASGAERWRTTIPASKYPLSSMVAFDLGGEAHVADTSGVVLHVADGKLVARLDDPVDQGGGKRDPGVLSGIATGAALDGRLYLPVSDAGGGARHDQGLRAFRLALADGGVTGELLWGEKLRGASSASIVAWEGRVYARAKPASAHRHARDPVSELDAAAGTITATADRVPGAKDIGLIAAEGVLVVTDMEKPRRGKGHHGAHFTILAIPGLEKLGEGHLALADDGSEDDRWIALWGGRRQWGNAHPFIYRDRLYVRSNESLYCIGE